MKKAINNFRKWALCALIIVASTQVITAGKPKKGNGNVLTKTLTLKEYHSIEIQTYCNVNIECGKMPMAKLTLDENLFQYFKLEVENGVLKISSTEWLKQSALVLELQVPFITGLTNSGWGKIHVNGLNTKGFKLIGRTGKISVSGKVNRLEVSTGTGSVNLENLKAKVVKVEKGGWGKVKVNATDSLYISGKYGEVTHTGDAVVIKDGEVKVMTEENAKKGTVTYIELSVYNNTPLRIQLIIKGPENANFSYGFAIIAYGKRVKNIPIGTKIWEQNSMGMKGKLLLEVKAEDKGKTIKLF